MAYQRHDKDNNAVNPGLLIDTNAYERHTAENALDAQPGSTTVGDDYGNQYKNWNADFIAHNENNEDKNPAVPLELATPSIYTGINRVQEVQTGTLATFTGGTGVVTVEGRWERRTVDDRFVKEAVWTAITEFSTASPQTYNTQPADTDYDIRFVSHAYDELGVNLYDATQSQHIYSVHSIVTHTDYTGTKKAGQTLNVYTATATGGIPPINYLIQLRFSNSGTGGWGENQNLASNLEPGEMVQYTIPDDKAGRYIQIRTRTRDNNGVDNQIYNQIWSTAPDSALQVADYLSVVGTTELSGELRVGQDLTITAVPTFSGGAPIVKYEYQWQMSDTGTGGWTGFSRPWTEYNPATIIGDNLTKSLDGTVTDKYIRLQARATDSTGEQVVAQGTVYGPVASEAPEVFANTAVVAPLGILEGAYRVNEVLNITAATFTGGAQPVTREVEIIATTPGRSTRNTSQILATFDDEATAGPMLYTLGHDHEHKLITVVTTATDAEGHKTIAPIPLFNKDSGAVLPYEPPMTLVSATQISGDIEPGSTIQITCAEYSGGIAPQKYHILARLANTPGGAYDQVTVKGNATPGQQYSYDIPADSDGKYLTVLTRVADNNRDTSETSVGYKQKFDIHDLGLLTNPPLTIDTFTAFTGDVTPGSTIDITSGVISGGVGSLSYSVNIATYQADGTTHIEDIEVANPAAPSTAYQYTIPPALHGRVLKLRTDVSDEANQSVASIADMGQVTTPPLLVTQPTQNFGLVAPGSLITIKSAVVTGGYGTITHKLVASDSNDPSVPGIVIEENATPNTNYDYRVPTSGWENRYAYVRTEATDEVGNTATSRTDLGKVLTPASPTANGPRYAEVQYSSDLDVVPNYKLGQVLRVGNTITMTVSEYFGGATPYRYDLSYWRIYAKKGGASTTVYESPLNQPPGSSVTFTIPQSLLGDYLKVNFYLYDRLLTSHKKSFNMYTGDPPNSYLEGVIGPAL